MAKPKKTSFSEEFEPILLNAWGSNKTELDKQLALQTRKALSRIRLYYRFKDEYPSKIRYSVAKNRAGYLAAFGQCHAYLSYTHLKKIENHHPLEIPNPGPNGELTVTVLGGGGCA